MTKVFPFLHSLLWGPPLLMLMLGDGLYLTAALGIPQIRLFPQAVRAFLARLRPGASTSSFRCLCTALAATVGTGNLVGVAGALCLGGPGAIFWMWICGWLGMAVKFAEATLAVHCREKTPGGWSGGPMVAMVHCLGNGGRVLAVCFAFFGVLASFGVGNAAQVNAALSGIGAIFSRFGLATTRLGDGFFGLAMAILVGAVLLGGARRIGSAAELLVPLGAAAYIGLCVLALIWNREALPAAVGSVFRGAFSPRAVTGGIIGSVMLPLKVGCARGVFTNEAGMGTAAIAHASADVAHPVQQGLMGMMEVFLDTMVICTLTALVILTSGVPIPYGRDAGGELTTQSFARVYGENGSIFLGGAMVLFALASVLGWSLYGGQCARFLLGDRAWKAYALCQSAVVFLSSLLDTAAVWQISEVFNGLMAVPNLLLLAAMTPTLARLTKDYRKSGITHAGGGNYADFHQCKPL